MRRGKPLYQEDYLAGKARSAMAAAQRELRETGTFPDRLHYDVAVGCFKIPLSRAEFLRIGAAAGEGDLLEHIRAMGWPFALAARSIAEASGQPVPLEEKAAWPAPLIRLLREIRPRFFLVSRLRVYRPARRGVLTVEGFHPARGLRLSARFFQDSAGRMRFGPVRAEEPSGSRADAAFAAVYLPAAN